MHNSDEETPSILERKDETNGSFIDSMYNEIHTGLKYETGSKEEDHKK